VAPKAATAPKEPAPSEPAPAPPQESAAKEALPKDVEPVANSSPPQWPRRQPEREKSVPPAASPKAGPQADPEDTISKASSAKGGFGLPPPGTITKKPGAEEAGPEPASLEDDEERAQEVSFKAALDPRYVGLVIGKAGETIKSFKKQSGASIEIDQNLPDGMPRVVIYRGTKKQVAAAKKLVEQLVQRAKEDEKAKTQTAPVTAGMGILGRGDSKEGREPAPPTAEKTRGEPQVENSASLPPWRRSKPEEEPRPTERPRNPLGRRDTPWTKKEKELEAAPSGSLTGSLTGESKLSMRPAWMKPGGKGPESAEDAINTAIDKSVWHEHRYGRSLMLQAKQKILRSKAYEVPKEMMSMTTGPRPKYKPDRRDKEGGDENGREEEEENGKKGKKEGMDTPQPSPVLGPGPPPEDLPPPPPAPVAPAAEASAEGKEWEEVSPKKSSKGGSTPGNGKASDAVVGPYENAPGDSKDIMKLKKKLREIQKIEDALSAGVTVEPNQVDKVEKKAGYLEELKVLESIVHSSGAANGI